MTNGKNESERRALEGALGSRVVWPPAAGFPSILQQLLLEIAIAAESTHFVAFGDGHLGYG